MISERLGQELESCSKWLVDNKLSLHLGKTESILFGSKRKLKKIKDFFVYTRLNLTILNVIRISSTESCCCLLRRRCKVLGKYIS